MSFTLYYHLFTHRQNSLSLTLRFLYKNINPILFLSSSHFNFFTTMLPHQHSYFLLNSRKEGSLKLK